MQYPSQAAAAMYERPDDPASMLIELVGSRLCHDLISPIGAVGNGLELLQMSDRCGNLDGNAEIGLIEDALHAARDKLSCFRVAFGAAGDGQQLSEGEIAGLLAHMSRIGRVRISSEFEGGQPRIAVKMLALALMCLETAMPWGGAVRIGLAGRAWRLTAEADRTNPDRALWAWLDGDCETPRQPVAAEVHFPLLRLAAMQAGRPVRWSIDDAGAEISF